MVNASDMSKVLIGFIVLLVISIIYILSSKTNLQTSYDKELKELNDTKLKLEQTTADLKSATSNKDINPAEYKE